MERFVVDNSVVMAWGLAESDEYSDAAMEAIAGGEALVPGVWPLEFANALVTAERRKRLTESEATRLRELVLELPITVVPDVTARVLSDVLALARQQGLSVYDASYLDLAMREGVPLASVDDRLRAAALRCDVTVLAAK